MVSYNTQIAECLWGRDIVASRLDIIRMSTIFPMGSDDALATDGRGNV